jgi:hypothetical protein
MAASKWRVYNEAKQKIANGTVDLDAATLRMALFKSGGNVTTLTLSTYASLTTKVSGSSGYTGNKTLTTSVIAGANASTYKFKFASVVYTASGANLASIRFAVIYVSGGACICFCSLSTATFTVTQNNTLTIAADATGGAFTIGGGTATS